MDKLRCVVERITYANEENGYAVLRARAQGHNDLITVVGNLASVNVGSVLSLSGKWKLDKKYGRQFSAENWEESLPATALGIEKYLGSGMVKGVGPKFAKRIVEKFGVETMAIIEETPEQLNAVPGLGSKRIEKIVKAWNEHKEIKNIMIFLQEHNVGASHAVKIFKAYGGNSIAVVKENPYRLADDIWGIGFKTADKIAQNMGFAKDSPYRCRSGLAYVLNEFAGEGHCYAVRNELIEKAVTMLDIDTDSLSKTVQEMLEAKELAFEEPDRVYLPPLWFSEKGAAHRLRRIMASPRKESGIDIEAGIVRAEKSSGLTYDEVQRGAIRMASQSKVLVITGGPGVGKTTTTKGIISAFAEQGLSILLAAPTGRAAKRLSEATGRAAKTIHRLLESKPPSGYGRNADNPLEGDVLLIDECSMVDIVLMYSLLKAVPDGMVVVFVGDADQLPSVGPGNVLRDLISSGGLPVVRLTKIYRQAQSSLIITNAHRINKSVFPILKGGKHSDFFFIEEEDTTKIPGIISELCLKRLPGYYHVDPIQGIQVLTPMQRTETGAANLNAILQNALNPSNASLRHGDREFRQGDKVLQIKNNYERMTFNGDIGVISKVDMEERELTAVFDGRDVLYDISELDELVLAYATTIHKAQGSEYPIVITPFTTQHFVMLAKNLLYTAVTRARKAFVLIGTKKAVGYAINNDKVAERNTMLAERLAAKE